jgi:hypothetical protein
MAVHVDLSILDEPLQAEAYDYVRDHAPQYLKSIEKALRAGATPAQIYSHYMTIAPHRQPLWLRLKHCAQHIQAGRQ